MNIKTNIPDLESLIETVFIALKKLGKSGSNAEIDKTVIQIMSLPKDITLIPHGQSKKETALQYRLRWARTYLKNANILNNNSRGKWSIADDYLEHASINGKDVVKKVRELGKGTTIKQIKTKSLIERIEIQYFRSIYRTTIKDIHQINVFTGKNDVGKSNILKALNLFFNNCIVTPGDYCFFGNYNLKRLEEVRKDTVKGKQFIQIKVTFRRGEQYEKTLPETFTVTKKWMRDSSIPQIADDIEFRLKRQGKICNDRNKASLTRFLNGIRYVYVPAIKDSEIFNKMLQQLQDTVYTKKLSGDTHLSNTLNELFENVVNTTSELSKEFKKATDIDSMIATPTQISELYHSLKINTKSDNNTIPLEDRGDGIRVRYIPSILNYTAVNSNEKYIWGFEEPENSLEFNMARKMADDFYDYYKNHSTIFLTTHSPAFIDIGYKYDANGYRCYKDGNNTNTVGFSKADELPIIAEELGYSYILKKQYDEYKELTEKNKKMAEKIDSLKAEIEIGRRPAVLTEGKTDAKILRIAWSKLYDYECPFDIKSCSVLDDESNAESMAGAGVLNKTLCGTRWDSVRAVIGIFDNDKEGKKGFELDRNFQTKSGHLWKMHRNKKCFAFLIPTNTEIEKIAEADNLSIEFLFDRECLDKEVDGKRLKLISANQVTRINGLEIITDAPDEYWYCSKIDNNTKVDFAEYIVPTFEKDKFVNFKPIFNMISDILEEI